MRTSLKKLRGFAQRQVGDGKDKKDRRQQSAPQLDELARATQDMIDMRDCYDSLFSAAAATANSAYEFSESLREMGECLLEKTALNDDEESGRVLLMLGKLQIEIQKLIDNYRSHIGQTITKPAESLLNELRIVEDMKRQCDVKRKLYEDMVTKYREKGRSRSRKGESVSSQQLQEAHDNYDEEATLFVFRLKSLKQGQSRSLLTQAARHHAAQLCFFRKALSSLERVEPDLKSVTEHHHIDYQFIGLGDDDMESVDNDESDFSESESSSYGDGELSFDYGRDDQGRNAVSTPRESMEIDQLDLTFPQVVAVDAVKENTFRNSARDSFLSSKGLKTISQSAPLSADNRFMPVDRETPPLSSRKYYSYVLPTPTELKRPVSTALDAQPPQTRRASVSGPTFNYRHSSPFLEPRKYETTNRNRNLSGPILRESNNNTSSLPLLHPLPEEISPHKHDHYISDTKKIKSFSGPLNRRGPSSNNPILSKDLPKIFSGPLLRTPVKVSPSTSPTFVSSPQISELHELPRPPAKASSLLVGWPSKQVGYSGPLVSRGQEATAANQVGHSGPLVSRGQEATAANQVGHSGPLVSRGQEATAANQVGHSGPLVSRGQEATAANQVGHSGPLVSRNQAVKAAASLLPVPPAIPRSFSIPSSEQRGTAAYTAMPQALKTVEGVLASPPLTPISLPGIKPATDVS